MRLLILAAALAAARERPPIVDPVLYDAVVLGGGPAAVTAAARLAARGKTVMLLESGPRLGAEGGLCAEARASLPDPGAELVERRYREAFGGVEALSRLLPVTDAVHVRLRARAQRVTPGEHLVSVRYHYQGLPRLVRARYAVLSWRGEALIAGEKPELGRLFYASALPGPPVLRGHCAAAEVLRKLQAAWAPEGWPPCGVP